MDYTKTGVGLIEAYITSGDTNVNLDNIYVPLELKLESEFGNLE